MNKNLFQTIPNDINIESLKGKVKFGIDPTASKMHLGHLIPLKMVKHLKEKGCEINIILGTFTAQMGDPSGKDKTRPILSSDETISNASNILTLIERIIGDDIIIHQNHTWFDQWTLPQVMNILSKFNVNHLMSRDAFQKRQQEGNSIGMHELIVPILQGLDSFEIKSEIEIGGNDQLFNFHITREVQEIMGQNPETCILSPIINGTDGRKMSKTFNNCIYLDDTPKDVFGKVMSISDDVMLEWFPLFFDEFENDHPMIMKKNLAQKITEEIWSKELAIKERDAFESVFQSRKLPKEIKEISNSESLVDFIINLKNISKSEARRLIASNAVSFINNDGSSIKINDSFKISKGDIIKVGKRDFGKLV